MTTEIQNAGWRTDAPPRDGTEIVVVGLMIWRDAEPVLTEPFVASLLWLRDDSGFAGWHFAESGKPVARTVGTTGEVRIDWWLPMPPQKEFV